MKKWSDKTKRIALAIALIAVGIGAFCGIRFCLITDKPAEVAIETSDEVEDNVNVVINMEEVQDTEDLAISTEPIDSAKTTDMDDATQTIQNNPVKTENKPSEPPAEISETEKSEINEKPENKEIPEDTLNTSGSPDTGKETSGTPQNGEVKDGKIYIEGFGWVDYNGGGTSGTQAGDIYENGNKIGIMD